MVIKQTYLSDEEYVRSLYTARRHSEVIDELCTRLENTFDIVQPSSSEVDSEPLTCPVCDAGLLLDKDTQDNYSLRGDE